MNANLLTGIAYCMLGSTSYATDIPEQVIRRIATVLPESEMSFSASNGVPSRGGYVCRRLLDFNGDGIMDMMVGLTEERDDGGMLWRVYAGKAGGGWEPFVLWDGLRRIPNSFDTFTVNPEQMERYEGISAGVALSFESKGKRRADSLSRTQHWFISGNKVRPVTQKAFARLCEGRSMEQVNCDEVEAVALVDLLVNPVVKWKKVRLSETVEDPMSGARVFLEDVGRMERMTWFTFEEAKKWVTTIGRGVPEGTDLTRYELPSAIDKSESVADPGRTKAERDLEPESGGKGTAWEESARTVNVKKIGWGGIFFGVFVTGVGIGISAICAGLVHLMRRERVEGSKG